MSATTATRVTARGPRFAWLVVHRELVRTLLRRELRAKYKGSALGVLWSFMQPLLMTGVYTLVFSVLWKNTDIVDYPQSVLSGLAIWSFFVASIQLGAGSLVGNAAIIKKVWFPREIVPAAVVLAQAVSALITFLLVIPLDLIANPGAVRTVLLAVPMFVGVVCLALGIAWLLSCANVFYRDVEHLLSVIVLPWFFLTPIFYDLDKLPGAVGLPNVIHLLRYVNPVTPYIEGIRAALLRGQVVGVTELVYMAVVGPLFAYVGLRTVQRYEDRFAVAL